MAMKGGKSYTTADIEALPEGERAELIDGEMFRMDAPTWTHQELLGEIYLQISLYIKQKEGKCRVLPAPFGVYIKKDNRNYVEPDGSDVPKTDDKTSESIKAIKSREEYIISEAFEVVQAIVGSFNSTTTTSVEQKIDAKPIAPGMTMFIGVENNAYTSSSFLKNEKIIQTLFVFKVCYSIEEGKKQSSLSDLQMYEDQKERFRKIIEALGEKESALDLDDPDYDEKFNKLADRVELMTNRMDVITKKISELTTMRLEADRMACRQIVEQMQTKRLALAGVANGSHRRTSTGFTCTEAR